MVPLEVDFTASAQLSAGCADSVPQEYYWDFGDGSTSTEQNPTHTYDYRGFYQWVVTVTEGDLVGYAWASSVVEPFDLSFADDVGRARLCANSVTGEFLWFLMSGPYKGYYIWGYALVSEEPGLVTLYSPPWELSWQMLVPLLPGTASGGGGDLPAGLPGHLGDQRPEHDQQSGQLQFLHSCRVIRSKHRRGAFPAPVFLFTTEALENAEKAI